MSMGEYTWGQAELDRNEWYFQFPSITGLYRAWSTLAGLDEGHRLRIIGTAPYTMQFAPLVVFLARMDRCAIVPLLLLLVLLGFVLGRLSASRESRWLAVMLAYGGLRGEVLRRALLFCGLTAAAALALTVPLLQWLVGWELQYALSLLARLDLQLPADVLPGGGWVALEVTRAVGLVAGGMFSGAAVFVLRACSTEVGLLLKREE